MPTRNIALPPTHNTRAPEQWRIISEHVDFDDKTVLDLGCGHGDLLWRAWAAGARLASGIEKNSEINTAMNKLAMNDGPFIWCGDIDSFPSDGHAHDMFQSTDIIICFSVLSYLADPVAVLYWIRQHSAQALIECQLAGDGPGPRWLHDQDTMRHWLGNIGWKSIERIGETLIEDCGAKRGIWLCQ